MRYSVESYGDGYQVVDERLRYVVAQFPTNEHQDYDAAEKRAERYLARLLLGEA